MADSWPIHGRRWATRCRDDSHGEVVADVPSWLMLVSFCLAFVTWCSTSDAVGRAAAPAPEPGATYIGRENQLRIRIPRIAPDAGGAPMIDGRLDEPVWKSASMLTGFS